MGAVARRFEFAEATSSKFWQIHLDGASIVCLGWVPPRPLSFFRGPLAVGGRALAPAVAAERPFAVAAAAGLEALVDTGATAEGVLFALEAAGRSWRFGFADDHRLER